MFKIGLLTPEWVLYSGLFNIWVNSPLNPTGCQIDQYIPDRCRVDTSLPAHSRPGTCAIYSAQIAYRENLSGRDKKKMNQVPVIVWNPAYLEELEPVDPATFIR